MYYPGAYAKSCSRCGFVRLSFFFFFLRWHLLSGHEWMKGERLTQSRNVTTDFYSCVKLRDQFPHSTLLENQLFQRSYFEDNSQSTLCFWTHSLTYESLIMRQNKQQQKNVFDNWVVRTFRCLCDRLLPSFTGISLCASLWTRKVIFVKLLC